MGVYTAALNVGSFLTSVATAPLAELVGWRLSLAASALVGCWPPSCSGCLRLVRGRPLFRPLSVPAPPASSAGRVAGVALADCGPHARLRGPGVLLLRGHGLAARASSPTNSPWAPPKPGRGPRCSRSSPLWAAWACRFWPRFASTTAVAVTLSALWLTVPVGLLLAPALWWLWSSLGGVAQGGGITVIFIAIIKFAQSQAAAGRMSAVVQGVGYCFAALAPTAHWLRAQCYRRLDGPAVRDPRLGARRSACAPRCPCAGWPGSARLDRARPPLVRSPCPRRSACRRSCAARTGGPQLTCVRMSRAAQLSCEVARWAWVSPAAGLPPRTVGVTCCEECRQPSVGACVCRWPVRPRRRRVPPPWPLHGPR